MDFDQPVDRAGTASFKWDRYGDGVLPLWVADMDFASPPAVTAALRARADHGVFGYSQVPDSLPQAIGTYLRAEYGWRIEPDWLVWLPGVVPALNLTCLAFAEAGDEILTITPAYPPFLEAPANHGRRLVTVPAVLEGGRWQLPLEAMEEAVTPRTRVLLLCHPHNPLGRVWSRDELTAVASFCRRHDLVLCSDEIHCDLVLDDLGHVPLVLADAACAGRTVTLMSPSKTFNLPGLDFAFAVIPGEHLRQAFRQAAAGLLPFPGCFALVGAEAAYRDGAAWREELLAYLRRNRDLLESFVADSLPGVAMTHVEATYLAWLDVRGRGLADPAQACLDAGLALSPGAAFGDPGCLRLNFGCTRATLQEALRRLQTALG